MLGGGRHPAALALTKDRFASETGAKLISAAPLNVAAVPWRNSGHSGILADSRLNSPF